MTTKLVEVSGGPGYWRAVVYEAGEHIDGAASDVFSVLSDWIRDSHPGATIKEVNGRHNQTQG